MPRYKLIAEKSCDDFLNDVCNIVSEILKQQTEKNLPQEELIMQIRDGIKSVLKIDLRVSDSCGLSIYCSEEGLASPWSDEEEHLKKEGI